MKRYLIGMMGVVLLVGPQTTFSFGGHAHNAARTSRFRTRKRLYPIDNFFDRPGMVNAPFVYGWIPGDQESAVFWCRIPATNTRKPYRLMFKPADPKLLSGCALESNGPIRLPACLSKHDGLI